MDEQTLTKLKGFRRLLHDGVKIGADYVQQQQRKATAKPYDLLTAVPPISESAKAVQAVHMRIADLTYDSIRTVNRLVDSAGETLIREIERRGTAVGPAQGEPAGGDVSNAQAETGPRTDRQPNSQPSADSDGDGDGDGDDAQS